MMDEITIVEKDGRVYAKFFSRNLEADGVRFLTEPTAPLQLGLIEYPAGKGSGAHRHSDGPYDVRSFSEFLYIEKGRVVVKIYDDDWNVIHEQEVGAGDFLLFLDGGHSVEAVENCRILEVKQGPYPGDSEAKMYPDIDANLSQ